MNTANKILSLLKKERLTVVDLMQRLQITRTAVVVPLRQLESQGLIEARKKEETRVGKPAMEYVAVPGQEDSQSLAYPAFASILVDTLSETLDPQQRRNLMFRVGQKMADQLAIPPASDIEERLQIATAFADKLGAETQVKKESGIATIQSFSCPLGRTVRLDNCVCGVMASFFSRAIGTEVEECCDRGKRLRCKFVVKKPSSD